MPRNFDPSQSLTVELTVAQANAGYDFTIAENVPGQGYVLPRSFVHTGGGILTFIDDDEKTRALHADAGRPYPATIRRTTACTGSGFVQFFSSPGGPR